MKAGMTKEELLKEYELLREEYDSYREEMQIKLAALRSSEENYLKICLTSADAISINRLSDGMYVSVNDGFTRITGYRREELIGKTSLDLNIWADGDKRKELISRLKGEKEIKDFEAEFISKDGSVIHGLMSATVIEIDEVPHLLNITKDITRGRITEESLAKEISFMEALMNTLPDHIYFKDTESRFVRNSMSHVRSFGLNKPELLIGKTDFDFFADEAARRAYEDEQRIIATGEPVIKEEKLTRKDSSVAWFSAMKLPLYNKDRKIIGTFGISRDITIRKRAELENQIISDITRGIATTSNLDELLSLIHHQLSKAVYADNIFIALHNKKTGLFSFPYFVDKYDPTPEPTSMGRSCTAYVFRTMRPLLLTEELFNELCILNEVAPVGSPSPSWIGVPLQTPADTLGVLVLQHYENEDIYSVRDVDFLESVASQIAVAIDRKRNEEEIKLKNEMLQSLIAEKDKFFSILAHDLRGPMSAFVSATGILADEIKNMTIDEIAEITQSMKTEATNIYRLLENLLEWSRLQRGILEYKPESFSLNELVNSEAAIVKATAENKGIDLEINIAGQLMLSADRHMIEAVVRNLLSNAVKFTPRNGKVILTATKKTGGETEIKITDTGIGMNPELRSRLFNLNEKTSRTGTGGEPSTGLGLHLCREFVEKHNGRIWVESEEGKGSVFGFFLPALT
jgi:PAS domain S-box-containing protein